MALKGETVNETRRRKRGEAKQDEKSKQVKDVVGRQIRVGVKND